MPYLFSSQLVVLSHVATCRMRNSKIVVLTIPFEEWPQVAGYCVYVLTLCGTAFILLAYEIPLTLRYDNRDS